MKIQREFRKERQKSREIIGYLISIFFIFISPIIIVSLGRNLNIIYKILLIIISIIVGIAFFCIIKKNFIKEKKIKTSYDKR